MCRIPWVSSVVAAGTDNWGPVRRGSRACGPLATTFLTGLWAPRPPWRSCWLVPERVAEARVDRAALPAPLLSRWSDHRRRSLDARPTPCRRGGLDTRQVPDLDLIVRAGRIATQPGTPVAIAGGVIAEIAADIEEPAAEEIDACGRHVLAGGIDPHMCTSTTRAGRIEKALRAVRPPLPAVPDAPIPPARLPPDPHQAGRHRGPLLHEGEPHRDPCHQQPGRRLRPTDGPRRFQPGSTVSGAPAPERPSIHETTGTPCSTR